MASRLFDLVARAKEYAMRNVMSRRAADRLESAANEYAAGRKTRWQLEQEVKQFEKQVGQKKLHEFEQRGGTGKYGVNEVAADAMRTVTSRLGKVGQVIQGFFDRRTEGFQANQVRAALQLLKMTGVEDVYSGAPGQNESIQAAMNALEDHGWSVVDTMQTMREAEQFDYAVPPPPGQTDRGRKVDSGLVLPPGPQETERDESQSTPRFLSPYQEGHMLYINDARVPRLGPRHTTPQSSNVHSFQYDFATATLYVQYKAPMINPNAVTNYRDAGGLMSMAGDMGKTVMGKTNSPGALYAYFNVPIKIYKKMIAAESAGKAVWDMLRVRGSIWGHQFRYALVAGAEVPGENGELATYVPRKVVSGGYRSRSVAIPGMGSRGYANATLPQDLRGHSVIRAMRHRPGRGITPHRGRPDPPDRGR